MNGQFKSTSGNMTAGVPGSDVKTGVNPESDVKADSIGGFSLRTLYRGLARKDTLTPTYLLLASAIMPGSAQFYNHQWWKTPIIYGGIGGAIYQGINFNGKYHETGEKKYATYRTLCYAGAGLLYWGSMLDGILNFPENRHPDPSKAALYSALLPGLGQAYNGDWWHIPIWYGGLAACIYTYHSNDMQYKRFRYINLIANDTESGYAGHITADQAVWYRDLYRRYRDYSIVATVLVYALNIIDANVFAYMSDFNVSDDLSMEIRPTLIEPFQFGAPNTFTAQNAAPSAFGLQLQFNF